MPEGPSRGEVEYVHEIGSWNSEERWGMAWEGKTGNEELLLNMVVKSHIHLKKSYGDHTIHCIL